LILASFMVTTEDIPVAQLLVHKWSIHGVHHVTRDLSTVKTSHTRRRLGEL
jgi:hypothetical protein